jgi:hypothetical protein
MYAQTTTAKMKHNGRSCKMTLSQRCWRRLDLLVHDVVLTDSYRRFGKASCLHLRHLGSPKTTPDHSKWRHMADYLNLQKTSSALRFTQSMGKKPFPKFESISQWNQPISEMQEAEIFPFQADYVPCKYWSSDPRGCKGFPLQTGFRYAHVPNKTGITVLRNVQTENITCIILVTWWNDPRLGKNYNTKQTQHYS